MHFMVAVRELDCDVCPADSAAGVASIAGDTYLQGFLSPRSIPTHSLALQKPVCACNCPLGGSRPRGLFLANSSVAPLQTAEQPGFSKNQSAPVTARWAAPGLAGYFDSTVNRFVFDSCHCSGIHYP